MRVRAFAVAAVLVIPFAAFASCSDDGPGAQATDAGSESAPAPPPPGTSDGGDAADAAPLDPLACRPSGWCWENARPFGDALDGVWGAAANDVWAVGEAGGIFHFDGAAWSRAATPTRDDLRGVWAASATDIWAIGTSGVILHGDGKSWTIAVTPDAAAPRNVRALHGSGANEVWAVGTETAQRWNGTSWSDAPALDGGAFFDWSGVFVRGPNDVFLAGVGGGSTSPVQHWNGVSYVDDAPSAGQVGALCGVASGEVFASIAEGVDSHVWRRETSGTWTDLGVVSGMAFSACWGPSASDVWFVGDVGARARCQGNTCTAMPVSPAVPLAAIGPAGNEAWIAGASATLLRHTADATWTATPAVTAVTTKLLYAVDALSADEAFAVGDTALHRTASGWSVANARAGGGTIDDLALQGVDAIASNDAWAVGTAGPLHWDGAAWTPATSPDGSPLPSLLAVSASGPNDVWAVGGQTVAHFSNGAWSTTQPVDGDGGVLSPALLAVAALSPTDVWVGGAFSLLHWNGASWTKVNDGSTGPDVNGPVHGLRAFSSSDVWFASGFTNDAFHWTGSSYAATALPSEMTGKVFFPTMAGASTNDLWFLAQGGLAHWSGASWTFDDRPASGLSGVSTAGGSTWVVGANGTILRKTL